MRRDKRGIALDFSICADTINQDQNIKKKKKKTEREISLMELKDVSSVHAETFVEKCFILDCYGPIYFNTVEIDT